jgi:hypothetical protein
LAEFFVQIRRARNCRCVGYFVIHLHILYTHNDTQTPGKHLPD